MKRLQQTGWYVLKDAVDKFYEDNKEYAGDDLRIRCIVKNYEQYSNINDDEQLKYSALQLIQYLMSISNK